MKKRWTFELIVDTGFEKSDWSTEIEALSNDEATKIITGDLNRMLAHYPKELGLVKLCARKVE